MKKNTNPAHPGKKKGLVKKEKPVQHAKRGVKVKGGNYESNHAPTKKPMAKVKTQNPYQSEGKTDGEAPSRPSSSSPNYVQQSSNSLNKTRLSKPGAHVLQENVEEDGVKDNVDKAKDFPDQREQTLEEE